MHRRAQAIGEEARAKGINTQFGPGVNLMRTPQAGRAFECTFFYQSDPDSQTTDQTRTWQVWQLVSMSLGMSSICQSYVNQYSHTVCKVKA